MKVLPPGDVYKNVTKVRNNMNVATSIILKQLGLETQYKGFWPNVYQSRSVVAERSSALDSSSGVVEMWVRIPAWPVAALVSLSKTLNHNCFILRMGRKAVGPVCCVMHVKEPRALIMKEKGACLGVSGFAQICSLD